jgi:transcriptional regulator with GAF, ATPase, and Fis domain
MKEPLVTADASALGGDGHRQDGSAAAHDGSGPEHDGFEPWSVAEQLARTLRATGARPADVVELISAEAVRTVPGASDCGVIVVAAGQQLRTVAITGPVPEHLDRLQQELGTGPCLTAARKQIVVRIHDMAAETRWPQFRTAALDRGVASMLCLPLQVDDDLLGTLSLYGVEQGAFRDGAEPVARLLSALAAVALAEATHAEQLRRALHSRDLIGQAKGILMRERAITAEAAFVLLRERSQNTNTKLVDLARSVIEAGTLR